MLIEIWKPTYVEGYEVSNFGQVRNIKTNHILSPTVKPKGYKELRLKGKWCSVHRLVAKAFIDNPNNYPQVNHKDHNEGNNLVLNLEWCTGAYNIEYSQAKTFYFKSPEGVVSKVHNLNSFCRRFGLPTGNMHRLWTGKHKKIKGWTRASAEDFLDVIPSLCGNI
jgi:hypothetical protein